MSILVRAVPQYGQVQWEWLQEECVCTLVDNVMFSCSLSLYFFRGYSARWNNTRGGGHCSPISDSAHRDPGCSWTGVHHRLSCFQLCVQRENVS